MTGPYATLAPVTDVDPSTLASAALETPSLSADELAQLSGGRLLARSDRPIRGAAVDSRLVRTGQLFVALPGSGPTVTSSSPRPSAGVPRPSS